MNHKRVKHYRNIVQNIIHKNLSLSLTDSTEEKWAEAFQAIALIQYRSPWVDTKIRSAVDAMETSSANFQRALLELLYGHYQGRYLENIHKLMKQTQDEKVFILAAEFYMAAAKDSMMPTYIRSMLNEKFPEREKNNIILYLLTKLMWADATPPTVLLSQMNLQQFIPNETIFFSFQRKNRDYPGIAIIRDKAGNFVKDEKGNIFNVPQLARSINNLPCYLTNGNTPQGIFRMNGFSVSKSMAIGPTTNIQLLMPYETSPHYFLKDAALTDTAWSAELYKRLLPKGLQDYLPFYESYAASLLGRTEIIAHGTTVNPDYYKRQPYYPLTPTEGCLCTKEIWSDINGERVESDQQKLVNALKLTGGADGYCIVIEIDDQEKPITLEEIIPYLTK